MEISTVSGSAISNRLASAAAPGGSIRSQEPATVGDAQDRGTGPEFRQRGGRSLGVFGKELRLALMARFRARFSQSHSAYSDNKAPASADDVAQEAVAAAKQVARERPTQVAKSMVSFRATVRASAEYAQKTVGKSDDAAEVDDALQKVDQGLKELERASSSDRESSASVLSVDMRSKQRSTIRIRTQEGDVVRFDLKRVDRLSANDRAVADDDGFMSLTEVEMSSRTRLMMRVKGDINENELGAIRNVFAQAEAMANEFFDGDVAAAFAMAQGLDFDAEQLARVNMRFRSQQVSNVAYRETVVQRAPEPREPAPVPAPAELPPVVAPVELPEPALVTPEAVAEEVPAVVADVEDDALTGYFDQLSDFLRSIGEGFESGSFRYHYSESFKLTLLESVMHVVAPEQRTGEAATETSPATGASDSADD